MKAEAQEAKKGIAIAAAEQVYAYNLIARSISITDDTLKHWRDNDEQFSEQLEQARFRFISKKIKTAKPEFLLERLDRVNFAPPTQKTETTTIDPVMILLRKFGVMEVIENDRKATEAIQDSSQSGT